MLRALLLALALLGVVLGDVVVRTGAGEESCCAPGEPGFEACCCRAASEAAPSGGESCCAERTESPACSAAPGRERMPRLIAGCVCGGDHGPSAPYEHRAPPKVSAERDALPASLDPSPRTHRDPWVLTGRTPAPKPRPPRHPRA